MTNIANTNRLEKEQSPYLLQHAHNPVDWYPWSDEAFEEAKRQNKPVFLSIGYSTCHWCHVMAHESFGNADIAKLINDTFIPIKVDREERPDIDMTYMKICQILTGSGGWPLTIMMTPDKQAFFAGTYIQRETMYGRTGLRELIPHIKELWQKHNTEVLSTANQITSAIYSISQPIPGDELNTEDLTTAYNDLRHNYDKENGGFGLAPKFPLPHNLLFLLRYWKRTGDDYALEMVRKTLDAMHRGGIYDHIGFGFHRYSTDPIWLVPHFEKMLYDQALISMAYIEAFQITRIAKYERTIREIFEYVQTIMTSPEGGFYSAEDADSEGEEGKFYFWTCPQISQVLTSDESTLFSSVYHIESDDVPVPEGGSTIGRNIPHLRERLKAVAYELGFTEDRLREQLEFMRKKLLTARAKRIRPQKDDKILTDWNGLMIAALAKGAGVLNDKQYAAMAKNAADFIIKNMTMEDGGLFHRYRNGQAALPGNLDDYTFFIHGLIELYQETFEIDYLKKALSLNNYLIEHFLDKENGGFFFTADNSEQVLVRQKEIYDGAIPSGNSFEMLNLLRFSRITGKTDYEGIAAGISKAFNKVVKKAPSGYTQLLCAVHFALGPSYEVLVTGQLDAGDTHELVRALKWAYIPAKVMLYVPTNTDADIKEIAPYTKMYSSEAEKAKVYICIDRECRLPTSNIKEALELLSPVLSRNTNIHTQKR